MGVIAMDHAKRLVEKKHGPLWDKKITVEDASIVCIKTCIEVLGYNREVTPYDLIQALLRHAGEET